MSEEVMQNDNSTVVDNEVELNQQYDNEVNEDLDNGNLDDLFDNDTENYNIGGYDLSKYKDILSFEDENNMVEFNAYIDKFAKAGFTQEQIEFLIDDEIADDEPKELTKQDIKERLNSLSREEKRNYKAVNSFVNNALQGTELQGKERQIMSNPALVKLMNIVYKQSLGKTANLKSMQKINEKPIKTLTLDDAYDRLLESTKDNTIDKNKLIAELRARVADSKGLEELLSIIK